MDETGRGNPNDTLEVVGRCNRFPDDTTSRDTGEAPVPTVLYQSTKKNTGGPDRFTRWYSD